jgi:hypothetical protein
MPELNEQSDRADVDVDVQVNDPTQRWWERSSWYRRVTARLGLQGKLIICFMTLLLIAMSGSYYLFLRETRATLWHAICERIVNVSQSLAMAATQPLDEGDIAQLTRMSREFVKNDDIVSVWFSDPLGKAITGASQDPDYRKSDIDFRAGTFGAARHDAAAADSLRGAGRCRHRHRARRQRPPGNIRGYAGNSPGRLRHDHAGRN